MASNKNVEHGKEVRRLIKEAIIEYMQEHGYSPSIQEIGDAVGLKSKSSVKSHLDKMFDEGMLETDAMYGSPRAIRVPGYKFVKK